jgi:hypothetical protein
VGAGRRRALDRREEPVGAVWYRHFTAAEPGYGLEHVQSNHEGDLVDAIHGARGRCAAIVINAQNGIELGATRMMQRAQRNGLCRIIVVNRIDAENLDLPGLLEELQQAFGRQLMQADLHLHPLLDDCSENGRKPEQQLQPPGKGFAGAETSIGNRPGSKTYFGRGHSG